MNRNDMLCDIADRIVHANFDKDDGDCVETEILRHDSGDVRCIRVTYSGGQSIEIA